MKYYDITTNSFYEENDKNKIEITDEYWQELLNKQSKGGVIQAIGEQVFCTLQNEAVQNGEVIDISNTDEYKSKVLARQNAILKKEIVAIYQVKFEELKSSYLAKIGLGTSSEEVYRAQYQALKAQLVTELANI